MDTTFLPATLIAAAPDIAPASVLQLLEAQVSNGTLRAGELWLRLRAGRVVEASAAPVDVVRAIVRHVGLVSFRAVPGLPTGTHDLSPTALLLEAARLEDEGSRALPTCLDGVEESAHVEGVSRP